MRSLYKVTADAPPYVNGVRVAPGDLLPMSDQAATYERDLGYIKETTAEAEAKPLDLTEAERTALPALGEAGEDAGALLSEIRWSAGTGLAMTPVALEADGTGSLAEPAPPAE